MAEEGVSRRREVSKMSTESPEKHVRLMIERGWEDPCLAVCGRVGWKGREVFNQNTKCEGKE